LNTFTTSTPAARAWVAVPTPRPAAAVRLFCFPNAGGGAQAYRLWGSSMPASVEVCAVRLPGREARLTEPAFKSVRPLVVALADALAAHLDRPFAFFGHSMGAKVAFELARHLAATRGVEPAHLFVSGCKGPRIPRGGRPIYGLPEAEFIEELRRLNGTPPEVLEHPELMRLMLPLLRADFELVETYEYLPGRLLNCPVSAYGGLEDFEVPGEQLGEWRAETTGAFNQRMFPGDHFYLHAAREQLVQMLSLDLLRAY
jgi:medium-chain acyl-[acyl-carrier-protein] hydrolase